MIWFYKGIFIFFLCIIVFLPQNVWGTELIISNNNLSQGDTLIVDVRGNMPILGTFGKEQLLFFSYRGFLRAVIGIPFDKTPGRYRVFIRMHDGKIIERFVRIRQRVFSRVTLPVTPELGLTPDGLITKLSEEKERLTKIVSVRTPDTFFQGNFYLPLTDNSRLGSPFGEIRKTGDHIIRHLGVDFTAHEGASIGAMNGGIVRDARYDAVYGNMVVVDHGQGIFSLYLHLKTMMVKENDRVIRGQIIGMVGKTGYATAPHLHLSIKINNISVDPLRFVQSF